MFLLEVKTAAQPLSAPHASEPTSKEGSYYVAWVTDLAYQREIGLLLHSECKEDYVLNIGDLLGCLLVLPCPMIKVNGNLQPNPGWTFMAQSLHE